jgi:RNA 2',3'-cyclic 3'-phosphodiesterase
LAIELPDTVKKYLLGWIDIFRRSGADVSWTRPEAMHLTLKFLGQTKTDVIPELKAHITGILKLYEPFEIKVQSIGTFPNMKRPRVVWSGCLEHSGRLNSMVKELESYLEKFGFPKENRAYNAHLTLGRIRTGKMINEITRLIKENEKAEGPDFIATEAAWFQSILKPTGAEYKYITKFAFK